MPVAPSTASESSPRRDPRRTPAPRRSTRTKTPRERSPTPKPPIPNPFRNVYLTARPFGAIGVLVVVFVVAYFWAPLLWVGRLGAAVLAVAALADVLLLWGRGGVVASREVPDKLSMGDPNEIRISLANRYRFAADLRVLDEVPVQFQERGAGRVLRLGAGAETEVAYTLRPTERGVYDFGTLNVYATTPVGLVARRFRAGTGAEAKVYPSILQMQRYAFLATTNRLEEVGVKRVRRVGHTMEFDQIRPYVPGDDRRDVNWKATARRSAGRTQLMVNTYQEERAQPVVAALDMGRTMRSPFEGMTLLDHAVNASLVLLNTALGKHDKAGLVTFDRDVGTLVLPDRRPSQLPRLLEALYRLDPGYTDPSYEALYATLRGRLRQRSLVLLFTNLDTRAGLERQLPYLRQIARGHRLVVVLFENTGIRDLLAARSERLEDVYVKTVAEGLAMETREIARTLERHGIGAILTRPETLTVDAVNTYLRLKAQGTF
ncbi:MAG: DUF58 domain-containing protein [Bacteroidota bacterium]